MSWMQILSKTYENLEKAGFLEKGLLPIAHSTQKAHVEVTIDIEGNFKRASFVLDEIGEEKNCGETVIPVTQQSASRSSGSAPHPLCDKLKYLAGDYPTYCREDNGKYFSDYINQLSQWNASPFSNEKAKAVFCYLEKGTLIGDLVTAKIFSVDETNHLTEKWEHCTGKLTVGKQADAFVRFRVEKLGNPVSAVWQDENLQQDFISYYLSLQTETDFCYVTGAEKMVCTSHPSKIRNSGDKAKLISANDTSGYTYRGRFLTAGEAVTVSYEVSQKAHNALKFLGTKQGQSIGEKLFVLWGTKNEALPSINQSTFDFFDDDEEDLSEYADTQEKCAKQFQKAILGYKAQISQDTELALIGLDAATTGRLSIIYYREYLGKQGADLLDRIQNWHTQGAWYHGRYEKGEWIEYWGMPALREVVLCAYGVEKEGTLGGGDEKQRKKIMARATERLFPCVTDGAKIPSDMVALLLQRAYHPQNYENRRNWERTLSVACSAYKKYLYDYKKEVVTMDLNNKNLDFQCGRLLAVADAIETWVLLNERTDKKDEIRPTNAMRYFTRFTKTPCETWMLLSNRVNTYRTKLGMKGEYLYGLLGEISQNIDQAAFRTAKNLDGTMVLGFDSQRKSIRDRKKQPQDNAQNEEV